MLLGICNACHPFYTGTQKFVDTAGRVDKFQQRMEGDARPPRPPLPRKRKRSSEA